MKCISLASAMLAIHINLAFSSTYIHVYAGNTKHEKRTRYDAPSEQFDRRNVVVHASSNRMAPMQSAHSRLPATAGTVRRIAADTRVHQSSIPVDLPPNRLSSHLNTADGVTESLTPAQTVAGTANLPASSTTKVKISKMDVALFFTYFFNMIAINLSVLTVPALAAEHLSNPKALSSFVAGVASMAALGGGFGKIINGFVCQRLGGRRASFIYLLGLAALSMGLSTTSSLAPIGVILVGYEFLSSIQWTSICNVLDQNYRKKPEMMARGIAILSLSSTMGALAAKTFGAMLLKATNWRFVSRCGTGVALLGALSMYFGVSELSTEASQSTETSSPPKKATSPIEALKTILGNKLFWMIGIGHSLGYLARGSDRLLITFLHDTTSLPQHICATLTSSVTIGFVAGLVQGAKFSKIDSVKEKMSMMKKNYIVSALSVLGLAVCGLNGMMNIFRAPYLMAGAIALLSGITASTVSFQFYQIPNLVSATVFSENSAVSLSLLDAAGFFMTAQVLAANTQILSKFGWSASWTFLALFFAMGGTLMMKSIEPVLLKAQKNIKASASA